MKAGQIQEILSELGTRPSKRWGQHFLLSSAAAEEIVALGEIQAGETVLEVGPGVGILTAPLLDRTRNLIAVEKDPLLAKYLRKRFPQLELLIGDVLRVTLPPYEKVVSNLPFEISSPFLGRLLDIPFERAVLTLQREFAERVVAEPGTRAYSRLSVKIHYRAEARVRWTIPRSAFWPAPEVDAAVVQIDARDPPFPVDRDAYFRVVDALFMHRRKTALNALRLAAPSLGRPEGAIEEALQGDPLARQRADGMQPEEMAGLTRRLFPSKD
ncbi:MAG: 16S rRNA (adenine(1518)-N(6)/adenine(1519)-N(6))-dimethyltransferase RsmA [Thermoplasmata archaeon]|jgi:16S rRNA (adenine1518-N6/adenine1519-N6)-dimethyltransferase